MRRRLRVLIVVENLPVPFDRRTWSEATTLRDAGHEVTVICPKGPGYQSAFEVIDGILIYRHPLPIEARGTAAYCVEYPIALFWEFVLALKVWRRHGFDVIHACNPPDLIFLIGLFFKFFAGNSFVFDHHDANPEFYEAKFGRATLLASAAARREAHLQGSRHLDCHERILPPHCNRARRDAAERVFVVRSGPNLARVSAFRRIPNGAGAASSLVGYVGVISRTEGLDLLLASVKHTVYALGRRDIHFAIAGAARSLIRSKSMARTWTRRLHHLRRPDRRRKAFDHAVDGGRLRQSRPRHGHERHLHHEQDHGVHGARQTRSSNSTSRRGASRRETHLSTPRPTIPSISPRRSWRSSTIRSAAPLMGEYGRKRVEETLAWHHEQPKLLNAYAKLAELRRRRWKFLNPVRRLFPRSRRQWQQA